jgi:hypothetical protein
MQYERTMTIATPAGAGPAWRFTDAREDRWQARKGRARASVTRRIEPVPGGVRVTVRMAQHGPAAWPAGAVAARAVQERFEAEVTGLQAALGRAEDVSRELRAAA